MAKPFTTLCGRWIDAIGPVGCKLIGPIGLTTVVTGTSVVCCCVVCVAWRDVARARLLFSRRQLCCFYSKERYGGADVVLGVGLSLDLHAGGGLKEVSTPFDLISEAHR